MARTVMLMGMGALGAAALEILARSEGVDRLVCSDVNEELGVFKMDCAAVGSALQGFNKRFEFRRADVTDIDGTARLLQEIKPDVILCSTVTEQRRHFRKLPLPEDVRERLNAAGTAGWIAWNLLLPGKFIQSVIKSGIQTHVVNSSYPDAVNAALWKRFGFGPTVGAGNIARIVGNIAKHVSTVEDVPVQDITVCMVVAIGVITHGARSGVPFFLRILLQDRDITEKFDIPWLVDDCLSSPRKKVGVANPDASSILLGTLFARNVLAIAMDSNEYVHAPGPNGLLGGYPTRLGAKGAQIVLPQGITMERAIAMNEEGMRLAGIARIEGDGTVVLGDKTYYAMKELGYDCKELPFDELETRCAQLQKLSRRLLALGEAQQAGGG